MPEQQKFVQLGRPRRIWAVGAVHGEATRLAALHDDIGSRFRPGDRLVYLGNMIGRGPAVAQTVDELLAFRRAILSIRGVIAEDVVYLRGGQEEMWQKLLQLQFAPNPTQVLDWMLAQGVDATLTAYGGDGPGGMAAARDGAVTLTRWTNQLRAAQRAIPGHDALYTALRRAAYTGTGDPASGLLFVNAGLDPSRPLGAQGDSFWWGWQGFPRIVEPVGEFLRVVRGFDPGHGGVQVTTHAVTLDGGAGFGGTLVCGCFAPDGEILELVEV
ncbi:MAG: hypothetical protein RLY86_3927 [Pseudomonadota bacterium]|jgi:hypothetical protein